jgi:hypothetical protein
MGYEVALNKAWAELADSTGQKNLSVKFLADEYAVDVGARKIESVACNVPAKDFTAILILHYCAQSTKGLPQVTGEWLTFKELVRIEGYEAAFRQRSIEPIIRKYGKKPDALYEALKRLPGEKGNAADASVILETFPSVPVLIEIWAGDEEFGPEANILFDKSVTLIFCTEDIVALAGLVASSV